MDELGALNPEYRELIVAAKLEGMSYAEIAEELGKSRDAVRMQLKRALVELTKIFRDLESND
jgi:RNA polymerase sigma factor (sigma-70 family)